MSTLRFLFLCCTTFALTQSRGYKGCIVAIVRGVTSKNIVRALHRIPEGKRKFVEEVTMDMRNSMPKIVRYYFPNAVKTFLKWHTA